MHRPANPPRIGASFRAGGELCPDGVSDLLHYAKLAEEFGFQDFDASDHLLLSADVHDYPGGTFRWDVDSFWPEPLVLLAAVAAVTDRIQLTTSVLVAPLRPAVLIAKAAATVDSVSKGRLRLGIGSGWNRVEFDAVNVPYAGRTKRMEDAVEACRALWTQSPASFESETVSFDGVWSRPGPARPTGIPILLGGPATPAVAARIARIAEGWNPMQTQRETIREGVGLLRDAFAAAGRDPGSLIIRAAMAERVVRDAYERRDPAALRSAVDELGSIGVTDVKIYIAGLAKDPGEVRGVLAWISDALALET